MLSETSGFFYMFANAGVVVKFVILLLLLVSIISWTIIFIKFRYIHKAFKGSYEFVNMFWKCSNLPDAFAKAEVLEDENPISRIFLSAYMEKSRFGVSKNQPQSKQVKISNMKTMDNVQRALNKSINFERRQLAQLVPFLATSGNTAPFIGLFGTVWGIMNTFQGIGLVGSASLAVVAPGISEALIATAAGLAVAIPSVVAYNYFVDRIRVLESELRSFSSDLLNMIQRDIQKQMEV